MNVLQFDQKSKFIDQSFTQSVPSLYAVHIEDVKLIFFFNFRDLPEFLDKCPLKEINPILLGKEKFVLHPKVIPITSILAKLHKKVMIYVLEIYFP